jgi:hypothetical protein
MTAALILLQIQSLKFTGAKESVYIFSTLALEPWGRIGSAIGSHLAKLGITFPAVDDHGERFDLAVVVFVRSALVLVLHRQELPFLTNV